MTATKEEFFKPEKVSAASKAQRTDNVAREILASEASARARKTERLKELRLANEAQQEEVSPKPKKPRKQSRKS